MVIKPILWSLVLGVGVISGICHAASQACVPGAVLYTPSSDFVQHGDTVTHTPTGLMWRRCPIDYDWNATAKSCDLDESTDRKSYYTWSLALAAAENLILAGYNDWRLPNITELRTIVERRCTAFAINVDIFPTSYNNSTYWSSTTSSFQVDTARIIKFDKGTEETKSKSDSLQFMVVRDAD
tara:strand:+ start:2502 stop:3047 length:546 start_codon:yes stop_codon:yes gene_type:complete